MADRIDDVLAQLTLEEKASLTGGSGLWHTVAIPRVGLGRIKVTDGPSGARGEGFSEARSTSFPCGAALGATWDPSLVGEIGQALGREARLKGAHVLLGPTINLQRHPFGGRVFECYSEDPLLTTRLTVSYVAGVQSEGVGATPKHFAANDQEHERHTVSIEVDDRALREVYLRPFEGAVVEAGAWLIMAAYNRLREVHCTENDLLLRTILGEEWGFDGVVVSDWLAVRSVAPSLNAGLDLEMPGPPSHLGVAAADAVRDGSVATDVLDERVRRLIRLAARTGALGDGAVPEERDESSVEPPGHRELAHRASVASMVLAENRRAALPIDLNSIRSIAVLGWNAAEANVQGGGSAMVAPHRTVSVLDGLRTAVGDRAKVVHVRAASPRASLPPLQTRWVCSPAGEGFATEYVPGADASGAPVAVGLVSRGRMVWLGPPVPEIRAGVFTARMAATFRPDASGTWSFGLTAIGLARLLVDGDEVVDNWSAPGAGTDFFGLGSGEVRGTVDLDADTDHELEIVYQSSGLPLSAVKMGCLPPVPEDAISGAVDAAKEADLVVVVVGTNDEYESEGGDRTSMTLPGDQDALVRAAAAANPNTVVVLNAGCPMDVPWVDEVAAVLVSWFGGQEMGSAVADVLLGRSDPGGRLAMTFPRRVEDVAAHAHYPGTDGSMVYAEGIHVGHRHFDRFGIEPRWCFGHGGSYASFTWGDASRSAPGLSIDEEVVVHVDVINDSARAGTEVVQVYARRPRATIEHPAQALCGFAKVEVPAGESVTAEVSVRGRDLAHWDVETGGWVLEPGIVELAVGASSRDIRQVVTITAR